MATHQFEPMRYQVTIGSHDPVLRLADGDSVHTSTVDALGFDAQGVQVAARGNPQTGPFFVDGAEPGDTLAVRIDRLTPSRATGISSTVLAANVLDPDMVPLFARAMPTRRTKSRIATAGTPRRRNPANVGIRGSSQPVTWPSRTSRVSTRLDSTV